jgi:calcineurin-like phosphoesterase family protein
VPLRTSYGESGSLAGIVELLDREREYGPALWLDVGDLVVGSPARALLDEPRWDDVADLPIAAATAGNHEFDDGVDALLDAVPRLGFPVVCANLDIGLEPTALIEIPVGPVGVIGLTHPQCDQFTAAPALAPDWKERVESLAHDLRARGARWTIALYHDGVEWWPDGSSFATRADRLRAAVAPWAAQVDLVLLGHNFGAWVGDLAGTPAGEPHLFASSVLVVDLAEQPVVRGVFPVDPVRPDTSTPAVAAIDAAQSRTVAHSEHRWLTRTGAEHYLPNLIAEGFRIATGADAGLVMPAFHGIQAPFDGALAALGPGPVSELDVLRMFASPGYDPVVVELRRGELRRAREAHWHLADPRNWEHDGQWWNWCRMPSGASGQVDPTTVAVIPAVASQLSGWLGREIESEPAGVTATEAAIAAL